jgi:DNA-binding transcriptional LysR family regulator
MPKLPLEYIAAFAKVAELSSLTAAARALLVSKATVSKQIAEMEALLGVVLFARTTRSLTLTQAGEQALVRARTILDEAELMAEEAQSTRKAPSGRLRIAAPQTFSRLWLAEALPDFMKHYPDISLDLSVDDRTVDLVAGGFDAALRISAMPDSSLVARRLAPIQLYLVAAPSYWRQHGYPNAPQDLSTHVCIIYANSQDQTTWRFVGKDGQETKVKVSGRLTVNGGNIEMPALRAGLGVALLPDFAICKDVRAGDLEVVKCDWRAPPLTLHLLTPPGRSKPKRLEVFTNFLSERFGKGKPLWEIS